MTDKRPIHAYELNHRPRLDDLLQLAAFALILSFLPVAISAKNVALLLDGRWDTSYLLGWVSSFVPPLFLVGVMLVPERG